VFAGGHAGQGKGSRRDVRYPGSSWLGGCMGMQSAELGLEDLCCGVAAADSRGDGGEHDCGQPCSEDYEDEPPYGYEFVGVA
jgi:hypothetical protein